jgi:hypothetical protein
MLFGRSVFTIDAEKAATPLDEGSYAQVTNLRRWQNLQYCGPAGWKHGKMVTMYF